MSMKPILLALCEDLAAFAKENCDVDKDTWMLEAMLVLLLDEDASPASSVDAVLINYFAQDLADALARRGADRHLQAAYLAAKAGAAA